MNIFKNSVSLRGFLSKNAEVPNSDHIQRDSYAVLTLSIESGVWNKAANQWIPQTARHTVLCPGPYFCGFTRGMKQGDYVEVTGELHRSDHDRSITVAGERFPVMQSSYEVHALTIRKLEIPSIGVDESAEGEDT